MSASEDRCVNCDHWLDSHHERNPQIGCLHNTIDEDGNVRQCVCILDRRQARTGQPVLPENARIVVRRMIRNIATGMTQAEAMYDVEALLRDAWLAGAAHGMNLSSAESIPQKEKELCPYLPHPHDDTEDTEED